MQSVSSRIWTRIAVSISYDDNHYTTGTLFCHTCEFFLPSNHVSTRIGKNEFHDQLHALISSIQLKDRLVWIENLDSQVIVDHETCSAVWTTFIRVVFARSMDTHNKTESQTPISFSECNMGDLESLFMQWQMIWAGHVIQMSDEKIPKIFISSHFHDRNIERPNRSSYWKGSLRVALD